jgi:hypothetical protein
MTKGTETETLIDDFGIQIIVTYDYEKEPRYMEECHGYHVIDGSIDIRLKYVEVVINEAGVDILPRLNEQQKQTIIDNLCINS